MATALSFARPSLLRQPTRRDRRGRWLSAIAVWLTILLMTVPMDFDYSGTVPASADGNSLARALWLSVLALGWGVVLMRLRIARQVLRETNVFFLLFLALAVCSLAWSIDPAATAMRLPRLFIQCGAFLALAVAAWHARRFQNVVLSALTTLLGASLIFGVLYPEQAIHQSTSYELVNAWHGLTTHKNGFGLVGAVAALLWLQALLEGRGRPLCVLGLALSLTCVVLSRSSTSLVATIFSCATLIFMMITPQRMKAAVRFCATALTILILVYSLAILRVVPGLDLLLAPIPYITGKDLSFTGRAEIWAVVVDHIRLRPLLGSGYGAYWVQGVPSPADESYAVVGAMNGFYPGNSHNGYLDVLNDLGILGLLCLLGYLIFYLRDSLRLMRFDRAQGSLYLTLLLQQAIINLSEARWFNNTIFVDFALMSFATTCLARSLVEARAATRLAPQVAVQPSRVAARRPRMPLR